VLTVVVYCTLSAFRSGQDVPREYAVAGQGTWSSPLVCIGSYSMSISSAPWPFLFRSSDLFCVVTFASSIHFSYVPSFDFAAVTPFIVSPMKPTKLCLRRAFSHLHSRLFLSSRSSISWSPIAFACVLRSSHMASRLNRISVCGYLAILVWSTGTTASAKISRGHAPTSPWRMGAGCRPSIS
jgi:hypothetical protein